MFMKSFFCLYSKELNDAKTTIKAPKNILMKKNLTLKESRGQCYDKHSTINGGRKGIATQIKSDQTRALMGSHLARWLLPLLPTVFS